jgi:ABC-type bacteriocin/lantibiotic exporter with double-glycine peptidase domain
VALARTYARRPSVLFLDEPTSAIDPLSERQINEDFMEFADEKTAIIVTHRLNICKYVDKIIVMQQGSIVEIGSHEELININGIYKEMVLSQDTNLRLGIS